MENDTGRGSHEANISSSRSALPVNSQGLGIPVEEYLVRANTRTLLSSSNLTDIPSSSKSVKNKNNVVNFSKPAPESGKNVSELHRLCQTTPGLVPLFEIECDDRGLSWGGKLVLGDQTISRGTMRWQSKKAVREGLAEIGVEVVKGMVKNEDGETKNWVGMLHDYHAASTVKPIFNEQTLADLTFACTCTIPTRPSAPFGSLSTPFLNKKAARTSAAREAMQFLIAQDLAAILNDNNNNNSSSSSPSSLSSSSSAAAIDMAQIKKLRAGGSSGEGMNRKPLSSKEANDYLTNDASYVLKVLKLCSLLQIPQPIYQLGPNPLAPVVNVLSGAAYFSDRVVSESHPLLVGPVGEVRNVYGKKNAKEECARGVFQVLMKIVTTSSEKILVGGG